MRILNSLFSFSILAFMLSCSAKTYDIQGTIYSSEEGDDAVLITINSDGGADTIAISPVQNGEFQLKGNVTEPTKAIIIIGNSYTEIILENEKYTVDITGQSEAEINGGTLNTLVTGYKKQEDFKEAFADMLKASQAYSSAELSDEEEVAKAQEAYVQSYSKVSQIVSKYQDSILEGNGNTWAKAFTLADNMDWEKYDIDKRITLIDSYVKEIGENSFLIRLREDFLDEDKEAKMKATVANGLPFKEVVAQTKNGEELKLSEVIAKNEYTLLEFWASWCVPCRAEIPNFKAAYTKFNNKGFEIYALSLDDTEANWLNAMEQGNTPWLNLGDQKGFSSAAATDYGVNGIPACFLISKDGTIVASGKEVRGGKLEKLLEELL